MDIPDSNSVPVSKVIEIMVEYRSPCIFRNKSEFPDLLQQNLNTLEEFHLMEITKF